MTPAKQQAFKDMQKMGMSLNVFYLEKDILTSTSIEIEVRKFDFRFFNKKSINELYEK